MECVVLVAVVEILGISKLHIKVSLLFVWTLVGKVALLAANKTCDLG